MEPAPQFTAALVPNETAETQSRAAQRDRLRALITENEASLGPVDPPAVQAWRDRSALWPE